MKEISDCEYRDWQEQTNKLSAQVKTLEDEVKTKGQIILTLSLVVVGLIVVFFIATYQRDSFRDGAIKHGVLQYNSTNGVLEWK
jgi:hypothetical protein